MTISPRDLANATGERSTADMLRTLCERQRELIAQLKAQLDQAIQAGAKLSGELLEANEARKTALVSLATQVRHAAEMCDRAVKERDVVIRALRSLTDECAPSIVDRDQKAWCASFDRAYSEAVELLRIIDRD